MLRLRQRHYAFAALPRTSSERATPIAVPASVIDAEDQRDIKRDQADIRADQKDLNRDRADLRADRQDLRRDNNVSVSARGTALGSAVPRHEAAVLRLRRKLYISSWRAKRQQQCMISVIVRRTSGDINRRTRLTFVLIRRILRETEPTFMRTRGRTCTATITSPCQGEARYLKAVLHIRS